VLLGITGNLAGVPDEITIPVAVLGGILNSIPDLAGPLEAKMDPEDPEVDYDYWIPNRWDVYAEWHVGRLSQVWLWRLHTWVDELTHDKDGEWDWPSVFVAWLIQLGLIALYIFTR
jgi:hypothetical protein